MNFVLLLFLILTAQLEGDEKTKVLYQSLDPTSISQHLAFYELYKGTALGDESLKHAWKLLSLQPTSTELAFPDSIDAFISLINPTETRKHFSLNKEALDKLQLVCKSLPNRKLKGFVAKSLDEVLTLSPEEIDLSTALLLSQFRDREKIALFQAQLDMMALQVLARTGLNATPEDKIRALNQLIFFEMGFRFPPHTAYSKEIDHFTFLPQVLESRRGVCLGVSTLYLCIAQRIDLPLEIITPPGHIYIRYKDGDKEINIETTLRGVHIPSKEYLGLQTHTLEKRTIKEVIGMAHYNHASLYLSQADFEKACEAYSKAYSFMPNDQQLKVLYGASLFMSNRQALAKNMLKEALEIGPHTLAFDIVNGNVDALNLKPYFFYVDETRESIVRKKEALLSSCKNCPKFRSGLFQLATCYLQLDQEKKAIESLNAYHKQDQRDLLVEYYLADLYFANYDVASAWNHCLKAKEIANEAGYMPEALANLTLALSIRSPPPQVP